MPFVIVRTNIKINEQQEIKLKNGFGKAIKLIPGKSEEYLLISFEDDCKMYLRGKKDEPICYIEASIFGNDDHVGFDCFSEEITKNICDVLGVEPRNVYIKYDDIGVWSTFGKTFDVTRFW